MPMMPYILTRFSNSPITDHRSTTILHRSDRIHLSMTLTLCMPNPLLLPKRQYLIQIKVPVLFIKLQVLVVVVWRQEKLSSEVLPKSLTLLSCCLSVGCSPFLQLSNCDLWKFFSSQTILLTVNWTKYTCSLFQAGLSQLHSFDAT